MKAKNILLLTLLLTILFGFNSVMGQSKLPYNIKYIHTLTDKNGKQLGKVYIEDFKGDVFKKLMITKENKGKIDTLYFINEYIFKNPKGVDITSSKKDFNGWKIEYLHHDSIQLFGIGKNNSGASDPVIIEWNYETKIFEVYQTP